MVNNTMDALEWLRKQLDGDENDLVREMVREFAQRPMAAEVDALTGEGWGAIERVGEPPQRLPPAPRARAGETPGRLLDPQSRDGPRDDELLDLLGALEMSMVSRRGPAVSSESVTCGLVRPRPSVPPDSAEF